MSKYILTLIDGAPAHLSMKKCNSCPYLDLRIDNYELSCSKYINTAHNSNKITTINGYTKINNGRISLFNDIEIPNWCGLSNGLFSDKTGTISYMSNNRLHITNTSKFTGMFKIIADSEVEYSDKGDVVLVMKKSSVGHTTLPKPTKTTGNNVYNEFGFDEFGAYDSMFDESDFPTEFSDFFNTGYPNHSTHNSVRVDTSKICSCCGEEKKDVSREVNLGMCSVCFTEYSDNIVKKQMAYINNFRLKRKKKALDKDILIKNIL